MGHFVGDGYRNDLYLKKMLFIIEFRVEEEDLMLL